MATSQEPEIIEPEPERVYDKPDIEPKDFLLGLMRDKRLPLSIRMDAASRVAVYIHARLAQTEQSVNSDVKIHIVGGLPPLPGTNVIMPDSINKKRA